MAIVAELEERLLRLFDFEDIITCLKSEPAQWSDDKLRGILTAAYLSSVSDDELKLADESVTNAAIESMLGGSSNQPAAAQAGAGDAAAPVDAARSPDAAAAAAAAPDAGASAAARIPVHLRRTSTAVGSVELQELVQSELTGLTWAEAADTSEAAAPSGTVSPDALAKSLQSDGAAHARRASLGAEARAQPDATAGVSPGKAQ
jgi:hypothetical protein